MRAGIALGSNLGDRIGHLRSARNLLFELHEGPGPFLCSPVYETAPVDCPPGSQAFLNAAIELVTSLPPLDLLDRLQALEIRLGRPACHEFHGPRTIDLDILYCDRLTLHLDRLVLPHPRIADRAFVVFPLSGIRPDLILPGHTRSVCELREALGAESQAIRRTGESLA